MHFIFRRITSLACECGYVKLLRVNVEENKVLYNFSTRFGNYVSRVYISPQYELKTNFGFLKTQIFKKFENLKNNGTDNDKNLNLIVVNSILPPVIFQ